MNFSPRRERFRSILAGDACVHPASVFDPLSARMAEDAGFEVGMLAGSTASLAVLGAPDLTLLTLTEFAEQAYRICRAGTLPLLVDADHGYGNALNVARTVDELENVGVAALTIEDTELPQAFGSGSKPRLLPLEEGVGKMKAALSAREDPALVIVGRTSAAVVSGLDDMIARCRSYEATGVDAVFVTGLKRKAEVEVLRNALRIPIFLGLVQGELVDRAYLGGMGVRIALQGHQPIMAAVAAINATYMALRSGLAPDRLSDLASDELMREITREQNYKRRMQDWL